MTDPEREVLSRRTHWASELQLQPLHHRSHSPDLHRFSLEAHIRSEPAPFDAMLAGAFGPPPSETLLDGFWRNFRS